MATDEVRQRIEMMGTASRRLIGTREGRQRGQSAALSDIAEGNDGAGCRASAESRDQLIRQKPVPESPTPPTRRSGVQAGTATRASCTCGAGVFTEREAAEAGSPVARD